MTDLTRAQRELLREITANGSSHVSDTYQPAKKLVEAGYAHWIKGKYSDLLEVTPAGRLTLQEKSK